ncbi:MAG: hypothetical protein Q7R97_01660 [Candidatus Daviesbacteria bacterium]|nr:hypothetical protein [Candidatus Daviesbacteria bacterium]
MKKKIKAIISDFDGVLCHYYFYHTLESTRPELYEFINVELFKNNRHLVKSWMRGKLSADDINRFLAERSSMEFNFYKNELIKSVKKMQLNQLLLDFLLKMKKNSVKVALLTDNMDVFDDITVPTKKLEKVFDHIVSSSKYKMLKGDNRGEMIDRTRDLLNEDYENILVLDDWPLLGEMVLARKGNFYLYNKDTETQFEEWFNQNFAF